MARGCVIAAYPRWAQRGICISNHSFDLKNQHYEWLTVFTKDGSVRIIQHYPEQKDLGVVSKEEVALLGNPPSLRGIRSHLRDERQRR